MKQIVASVLPLICACMYHIRFVCIINKKLSCMHMAEKKWGIQGSNLHGLLHQFLRLTCLPISPIPQCLPIVTKIDKKRNGFPFPNRQNSYNKAVPASTMASHGKHHFPRSRPRQGCSCSQRVPSCAGHLPALESPRHRGRSTG